MKYISSQHYLDPEIVEQKVDSLKGCRSVEIPFATAGEIDGEEYAVQLDGHHTLAAARRLGLDIVFVETDDSEGLTGEALLEARWMDGDYYDVETSDPDAEKFYLVF